MRITRLSLPAIPDAGLDPVTMDKLGKTVVIAGRNGAGKTRLLHQLMQLPQRMRAARQIEPQIHELQQRLADGKTDTGKRTSYENQLAAAQLQYALGRAATFDAPGFPKLVPFVPNSLILQDPNQLPKQSLLHHSKEVDVPGVHNLAAGTFARIQAVQDRMWEATHQRRSSRSDEIEAATGDHERLQRLIEQFLGTKLTRSLNGEAQIFGFPLGLSALSDGKNRTKGI